MTWWMMLVPTVILLMRLRIRVSLEALCRGSVEGRVTISVERRQAAAFLLGQHAPKKTAASAAQKKRRMHLLLMVLRKNKRLRQRLLSAIELERLSGRVMICLDDAAGTALLTGAVRGALSLAPHAWRQRMDVTIAPDFFAEKTTVQVRCIFFAKMGKLMLCAAMLALSVMKERRVQSRKHEGGTKQWNIPSAR